MINLDELQELMANKVPLDPVTLQPTAEWIERANHILRPQGLKCGHFDIGSGNLILELLPRP